MTKIFLSIAMIIAVATTAFAEPMVLHKRTFVGVGHKGVTIPGWDATVVDVPTRCLKEFKIADTVQESWAVNDLYRCMGQPTF